MEELDGITTELARVFAAKQARREELARLPFPKKVETIVKLQEMAAAILLSRGKIVRVWPVNEGQE